MTPNFIGRQSDSHCTFYFEFPDGYVYDQSDFLIGSETRAAKHKRNKIAGKVAMERNSGWIIEWADISISANAVRFTCEDRLFAERMAHPVDPNITEKDINGATIIYPNSSNDGWLFAHSTEAHHVDRMWLASAMMDSLFRKAERDRLQQTLSSIVNDGQTNQQRGYYTNWYSLTEFEEECVAYTHKHEKLLYIGQHEHENDLNLRDMLLLSVKQVKKEWEAANKFDGVSTEVNAIISALEADHNFETRWVRDARIKAEAAARKAAAETETED